MSVGLLSANTWDGVSQPTERIIRVAVVAVAAVFPGSLTGLHFFPGWGEVEPGPLLALKYEILVPATLHLVMVLTASHPSPLCILIC